MNIRMEMGKNEIRGAKKRREKQNSPTALNPLYFNQNKNTKIYKNKKRIPFSSSWKILHV